MDYLQAVEANKDEMIEKLRESVRIDSVLSEPVRVRAEDGSETFLPFGKGIEDAYAHIMKLGEEMGFSVTDIDHYGGHIEWKVPGAKETFGSIGHLDVVPVGNGWSHEPFSGDIEDNRMYGRGTSDDKGPMFAILYAMKAIKDAGIEPKMNIRLIVGLDEETGMHGIERYIEGAGMPDLGITPDADFPLINGEMGVMFFDLAEKLKKANLKDGPILRKVEGGTAPNAVPDHCKAVIAADDPAYIDMLKEKAEAYASLTGHNVSVKKAGTSISVECKGIAAHGAKPEKGLNAISIMMGLLGNINFAGEEINEFISFYNEKIGFNLHGEGLGCDIYDEPSGPLIFNIGVCEINEDIARVVVNIRYPVTFTDEDVLNPIEKNLENTNIGIVMTASEHPIYLDMSDPFAKALLDSYREETGDTENQPQVIGGGTYAKRFNKMLAFGMLFPNETDSMHQADESIDLDNLVAATRIYAKMLYKICCEGVDEADRQ